MLPEHRKFEEEPLPQCWHLDQLMAQPFTLGTLKAVGRSKNNFFVIRGLILFVLPRYCSRITLQRGHFIDR